MHDHYISAHTSETLVEFGRAMRQAHTNDLLVSFDIETTGLNAYDKRLTMVSLSVTIYDEDETTYVVPLDHPESSWAYCWDEVLTAVARMLAAHGKFIPHNAEFEVNWVRAKTGVDLTPALHRDTQTTAHILNENVLKSLKYQAEPLMHEFGQWDIDIKDRAKSFPWFDLARYNALDTIATKRLNEWQQQALATMPELQALDEGVVRAQRAMIDASFRGIRLDKEEAQLALKGADQEMQDAAMLLMDLAQDTLGMDPNQGEWPTISWNHSANWYRDFMARAVDADLLTVEAVTGSGNPSWTSEVLTRQKRKGSPIAAALLRFRAAEKMSGFVRSWFEHADEHDRVHTSFRFAVAVTGRTSSSTPNMQQIPRGWGKRCWIPADGWDFCEMDYSQVEMRVAAELVHRTVLPDNPMVEAFRDGVDLHSLAATLATGGTLESVTGDERQAGKAINFGFLFGMGASKFVDYAEEEYGVHFTLPQAREVRKGFFRMWEGLEDWHEYQRNMARTEGYVTCLSGRRRRLPDAQSSDDFFRSEAERQAVNAPVQGTASDMMLHSLGNIYDLSLTGVRIVGTVHDSVLLEVRNREELETAAQAMLRSPFKFHLPMEVEVALGPRWGDYTDVFTRST